VYDFPDGTTVAAAAGLADPAGLVVGAATGAVVALPAGGAEVGAAGAAGVPPHACKSSAVADAPTTPAVDLSNCRRLRPGFGPMITYSSSCPARSFQIRGSIGVVAFLV